MSKYSSWSIALAQLLTFTGTQFENLQSLRFQTHGTDLSIPGVQQLLPNSVWISTPVTGLYLCWGWKRSCPLSGPSLLLSQILRIPGPPTLSYTKGTDDEGGGLRAELLFFLSLIHSCSCHKASPPLLQTSGLSCFHILTSLWSHPAGKVELQMSRHRVAM